MSTPLLEVENLRVSFPTHSGRVEVVKGLSFTLGRERLGIVGESGSGKSMTGRSILKLIRKPGEVTAYTVNVPSAPVHVLAPEGADITVDGNAAGKAPLAELSLPLGTHEVTATLPGGSKRGVTIAVRFGGANEARID